MDGEAMRKREVRADPKDSEGQAKGTAKHTDDAKRNEKMRKLCAGPKWREAHAKGVAKREANPKHREERAERIAKFLHPRWHLKRGITNSKCVFCMTS